MVTQATNQMAGAAPGLQPASGRPGRSVQPHFSQFLRPNDLATGRTPITPQQQAREAAQDLAAALLIQPVLAQVRDDPLRGEMFHGGFGEDVFAQQLDVELARRIAAGTNLPIVEAVYRQITQRAGRSAGAAVDQRA